VGYTIWMVLPSRTRWISRSRWSSNGSLMSVSVMSCLPALQPHHPLATVVVEAASPAGYAPVLASTFKQ